MFEIGFIGFGEAARAFVHGWRESDSDLRIAAYDLLFDSAQTRAQMHAACDACNVTPLDSAQALAGQSACIVAAVTPDQVLEAARSVGALRPEQCYLDINSAAPASKQAAGALLGEGYLDVAVLSPVHPARHATSMLVCGPRAQAAARLIQTHFPAARIFSARVGDASLVKMIRSIFVKGLESVTMECALAAYRAGLAEDIWPSLDPVLRFDQARALADYTLERVATHGLRRSAEMEQVCATLDDLGVPSAMSRAAAQTQALIGDMNLQAQFDTVPGDAAQIAEAVLQTLTRNQGHERG